MTPQQHIDYMKKKYNEPNQIGERKYFNEGRDIVKEGRDIVKDLHIIDDPYYLQIFKPGARVEIGDIKDPIEGTVIRVEIRGEGGGRISYEVSWWNGGQRECEWLDDHEVRSTDTGKRQPIGFR